MRLARVCALLSLFCVSLVTPLAAAPPDADRKIAADDVTLDLGLAVYTIAHLEAEGASDLGLFDATDRATPDARLARLSAARIAIPELVGEIDAGGVKQKIVYRDVVLERVAAGRADAFRAASITQTTDGAGASIEARYGPVTARGVDLVQMARLLTKTPPAEARPAATLHAEASVENGVISIARGKLEIHFGRASTRDVKARAPNAPPTENGAASAESASLARAALDVLRSGEVGSLELRDVTVTSEADGKPSAVKVGRLAVTTFAAATLAGVEIEDVAASGPEGGRLNIGRLALRDVELAPLFETSGRRTPHIAHAEIAGLDADAPRGGAGRNRIKIAAASLDLGDYRQNAPTRFSLAFEHLTADLAAQAETTATTALLALGYKELDLSGAFAGQWRETDQELSIDKFSIEDEDKGSLRLASTIVNVTGDAFSPDPATAQAALSASLLKRAEIGIENKGLFERLLDLEAKTRRSNVAKIREDYASAASAGVSAVFDDSPQARTLGAALAKFVAEPKRLRIIVDSAKGVGMADVVSSSPGEILRDLKLEAKAD